MKTTICLASVLLLVISFNASVMAQAFIDLESEKENVGFVPIINFRLLWSLDEKFGLLLDGDALAAPQGRAEDVQVAATWKFFDNLGIRAGHRLLEGGADNDEVYNFALFHYGSFGITYTFRNKENRTTGKDDLLFAAGGQYVPLISAHP